MLAIGPMMREHRCGVRLRPPFAAHAGRSESGKVQRGGRSRRLATMTKTTAGGLAAAVPDCWALLAHR